MAFLSLEGLTYYNEKLNDKFDAKANSADLNAVATSGDYADLTGVPVEATGTKSGLMSATDKTTVDSLKTVATTGAYSDLTGTPEEATSEVAGLMSATDKATVDSLKTVATTGAYADLTGVPVEATTTVTGLMSATDKTKLDAFTSAENYALKSDIVNVYKFKGSVATYDALPKTDLTAGDVYDVQERGINYAWTGEKWDALGEAFEVVAITNGEIDTMMA